MPNAERNPILPPPIPTGASRPKLEAVQKPPEIPKEIREESIRKSRELATGAKLSKPPEIPKNIREASIRKSQELMASKDVQKQDVVEAFEAQGFEGLSISATLEKKNERKGDIENKNQDNLLLDPETGLFGVLDGLGGEGNGDKASKAAEANIPKHYKAAMIEIAKMDGKTLQDALVKQKLAKSNNPNDLVKVTEEIEDMLEKDPSMELAKKSLALLESIQRTNADVKESGGKTTATIGFVHKTPDGKRHVVVSNVGDGAAFKRAADGKIEQLTKEDSVLNVLTSAGIINAELLKQMKAAPELKFPIPATLTTIQALGGDQKMYEELQAAKKDSLPLSYKKLKVMMMAALGGEMFQPSLVTGELLPGEELILGTDGLVDKLENPTTEELDHDLMKKGLKGNTQTERLNNLRQTAKDNTESFKEDDDIGIIAVAIN